MRPTFVLTASRLQFVEDSCDGLEYRAGDERVWQRFLRTVASLSAVAVVTWVGHQLIPVNATTVGFAYLLVVLILASTWGFLEAALSSVLATLLFNFFFFSPVGTFTIADPHNWVALFSFLATALIASRLSTKAQARALEAIERQKDVERLYCFSRAILLTDRSASFGQQLAQKLAEIFNLDGVVLLDGRSGEFHRAGTSTFDDVDNQLRNVYIKSVPERHGTSVLVGIHLGSDPVGGLAICGTRMPDSVLQGIANLVAIGLERARAQDLAQQVEAARQSEQLRTTLIDAMAHEFKTPLTLIRAATTSLLANPNGVEVSAREQLKIADEEAEHLRELIDNAVEMARLDTAHIEIHPEMSDLRDTLNDVLASLQTEIDERKVGVAWSEQLPAMAFDRRLTKLAMKQLLDNSIKYSPSDTPVEIELHESAGKVTMEITDHGHGIPPEEQDKIFERFYRSPSVRNQIPGSGLGLSIAKNIIEAHGGTLSVSSEPGRTTFQMALPIFAREAA
jgi:two-component system, OmpR family, sensor histidine kinase KdpD